MVFDLRRALLKKEEVESARLMDFEFRLRARTMRLLAAALGEDPAELAGMVASGDDAAVLDLLAQRHDRATLTTEFNRCRAAARVELIAERGDPTPYKLA